MGEIIKMILGERRRITTRITTDAADDFIIENATYILKTVDKVEASGTPDIVKHDLIITIAPQFSTVYILEFAFDVGADHIIKRITINVSD